MAGEWLKFEKSTLDKPEVLAVAAALGWDADMAIGKFVRMWSWFDTHTVNGDARGVTPALLDSILRVTGFVSEVQKVGWLEVHAWGIRLPKFDVHCGETAKQRALGAKRNAVYRASNAKGDDASVTDASPREEKRREEKKEQKQKTAPDGVQFDGVPDQVIADFKALRTKLRAPITPTALEGIKREAAKAGITLADALRTCCERGWRGFKAEWLEGRQANATAPTKGTPRRLREFGA